MSSGVFESTVSVYNETVADSEGTTQDSAYFAHENRKDVTWGIQVQGEVLDVIPC